MGDVTVVTFGDNFYCDSGLSPDSAVSYNWKASPGCGRIVCAA